MTQPPTDATTSGAPTDFDTDYDTDGSTNEPNVGERRRKFRRYEDAVLWIIQQSFVSAGARALQKGSSQAKKSFDVPARLLSEVRRRMRSERESLRNLLRTQGPLPRAWGSRQEVLRHARRGLVDMPLAVARNPRSSLLSFRAHSQQIRTSAIRRVRKQITGGEDRWRLDGRVGRQRRSYAQPEGLG